MIYFDAQNPVLTLAVKVNKFYDSFNSLTILDLPYIWVFQGSLLIHYITHFDKNNELKCFVAHFFSQTSRLSIKT